MSSMCQTFNMLMQLSYSTQRLKAPSLDVAHDRPEPLRGCMRVETKRDAGRYPRHSRVVSPEGLPQTQLSLLRVSLVSISFH